MAESTEADYHIDEDLEELFHSDLQNLELGHGEKSSHDDVIGDHLPEWLVGVIVVIVMLALAFFIMVITSVVKNRNKSRSSTYIGTRSLTSCDGLESGKLSQGDMKMTSFTSVSDVMKDNGSRSQTSSSDNDPLAPKGGERAGPAQGCRNPLYRDDDQGLDGPRPIGQEVKLPNVDTSDDKKNALSNNDINAPSTSNGFRGNDLSDHGKSKSGSHKHKSSVNKKTIKPDVHEAEKCVENDKDVKKRMFASKSKSGHSGSHKIEKNKEMTVNGGVMVDTTQAPMDAQTIIPNPDNHKSDNLKKKETCGSCEDSGVELGSIESHLREETGGSSESDDAGSDHVMVRVTSDTVSAGCQDDDHVHQPEMTAISANLTTTESEQAESEVCSRSSSLSGTDTQTSSAGDTLDSVDLNSSFILRGSLCSSQGHQLEDLPPRTSASPPEDSSLVRRESPETLGHLGSFLSATSGRKLSSTGDDDINQLPFETAGSCVQKEALLACPGLEDQIPKEGLKPLESPPTEESPRVIEYVRSLSTNL